VKTGVQRLRKRGCAKTKMGCAVEVRRVWMEVCRVKTEMGRKGWKGTNSKKWCNTKRGCRY